MPVDLDRGDVRRWSTEMFAADHPDLIDTASHAMADYLTGLTALR